MLSKRTYIRKNAWQWSDVISDIGLTALMEGIGALVTGPPGWIAGAISALAAVGSVVWVILSNADDNLKDLIGRIEALDYEDTQAEQEVLSWIETLRQYDAKIGASVSSTDPKERTMALGRKLSDLKKLIEYLKFIQQSYPVTIEPYLKDWGTDKKDFTNTLATTIVAYNKQIQQIDNLAQRYTQEVIKKNPKLYTKTAEQILNLTKEITDTWAAPIFTPEEKELIHLAKKIVAGYANLQEITDKQVDLAKLQIDLTKLLQQAKAKAAKRTAGLNISKRAVELSETPTAPIQKPEQMKGQKPVKKRPGIRPMPVVEQLQRYLNHIKTAAQLEFAPYLKLDGRYGSNTANSLFQALKKYPNIAVALRNNGVPLNKLSDYGFMNNQQGGLPFMGIITKAMANIANTLATGKIPGEEKSTQETPPVPPPPPPAPGSTITSPGKCNLNKPNPTPEDVVNCLQNTYGYLGNPRVNLYDFMRARGFDHKDMAMLIMRMYGGSAPSIWNPSAIIQAMGKRYGI